MAPVAAEGDSTSVSATPLPEAMSETHYVQFFPPHRRERALATTGAIWGMDDQVVKGHRWTIETDQALTADQTAPPLGRVMTNRVKASRALRYASIDRPSIAPPYDADRPWFDTSTPQVVRRASRSQTRTASQGRPYATAMTSPTWT